MNNSSFSIGIIGGADGPTAIFVNAPTNWLKIMVLLVGLAVLAVVGIISCKKRKSRKERESEGEDA